MCVSAAPHAFALSIDASLKAGLRDDSHLKAQDVGAGMMLTPWQRLPLAVGVAYDSIAFQNGAAAALPFHDFTGSEVSWVLRLASPYAVASCTPYLSYGTVLASRFDRIQSDGASVRYANTGDHFALGVGIPAVPNGMILLEAGRVRTTFLASDPTNTDSFNFDMSATAIYLGLLVSL